jgi:5-methylcytosine-specific restriction protein A
LFQVGRQYKRGDLHDKYGGNRRGGIAPSTRYPVIFLFSGKRGAEHGYDDKWEPNGTFSYFGEGQLGDMKLTRGNLAILNHSVNGKELHLFESISKGFVRYAGLMVCAGYETREGVRDRANRSRKAIVFHLVPESDLSEVEQERPVDSEGNSVPQSWYWQVPMEDLKKAAREAPSDVPPGVGKRNLYHRSETVKIYVQRRAEGQCEGCHNPAPFVTKTGRPYLEPHHTRRLSDGGPDDPKWVVAVCPTCHRRAHYSKDAEEYNQQLMTFANEIEA